MPNLSNIVMMRHALQVFKTPTQRLRGIVDTLERLSPQYSPGVEVPQVLAIVSLFGGSRFSLSTIEATQHQTSSPFHSIVQLRSTMP